MSKKVNVFSLGGPGEPSVKITNFDGPVYSSYTGEQLVGGVPRFGQLTDDPSGKNPTYHGVIVNNGVGMAHCYRPRYQSPQFNSGGYQSGGGNYYNSYNGGGGGGGSYYGGGYNQGGWH
ncbi:hypothetical protein DFA_05496 [Cavenderia fasciculata]|uniref:Uncharacterized protein n=1 Tax=Cavenderia fasciculata TaxID=261658 RepID=F4PLE2_CACFS|nr:uncharacterized protein DFA_05496 [Cavenderia fasciculata]EGG23364.1 hypothetical protein DFA_05496 [Cavenderia fasciculata]|eukprot:XP_004361215.1 hypothetical protein DFA_05496 [Cavenderia fasciculata]